MITMKETFDKLIGIFLMSFFLLFLIVYDCFYFFIYPEFSYGSDRTLYLSIIFVPSGSSARDPDGIGLSK
jgi:hypothetical protein